MKVKMQPRNAEKDEDVKKIVAISVGVFDVIRAEIILKLHIKNYLPITQFVSFLRGSNITI